MKRLGAGAGFAGDRIDPAVDLVTRGALDALVFECLAERTIARAHLDRATGIGAGWDPLLAERLTATLPTAVARGTTVITNAGAANPRGAGEMVLRLAQDLALHGVTVAVADGDDVVADLVPADCPVLGGRDGETLADHVADIVSANAYLGTEALVAGLRAGADVVISGRTSDAALFLAPLQHWYGWEDLDLLAQGVLVGHLLECAGQLTGGYFADGGRKKVPGLARLGFPMADVTPSGTAVFSKLPGTGGRIDRATVLEQLLYEVHDPARYVTPDVIAGWSELDITETGPDEVTVAGARGAPAPSQLKVSVGLRDGFHASGEISYAGTDAVVRAGLAAEVIAERWHEVHGLGHVALYSQLVGVNSCTPWREATVGEPPEVRLRIVARTQDERAGVLLTREVEALYTNGPAGGGGVTTSIVPTLGLVSTLIDRRLVQPTCTVLT